MFSRKSSGSSGAPPSIAGNVGALLTEIASAPQQRRLSAVIGEVEVVLDVGNRELLRIITVTPESLPHSDAVLIASRDDDNLRQQLEKLGGVLSALTDLPGKMILTSAPAPLRYSSKLQGFSKDELTGATRVAMDAGARVAKAVDEMAAPVGNDPLKIALGVVAAVSPAGGQGADVRSDAEVMQAIVASTGATVEDPSGPDLRFFEQLSSKCEAALVIDLDGEILHKASNWEMLDGIRANLIEDIMEWLLSTAKRLSARQFLMLRGGQSSDLSLCILIDTTAITIVALHASSTGRAFSAIAAIGL